MKEQTLASEVAPAAVAATSTLTADGRLSRDRTVALMEVLAASIRLGLTSFGGPVAHLGYFRTEYVTKRGWIDEATYADLVALAQFLPGAASSKLGIMIGTLRAGILGGLVAWLGFSIPSALALVLFALAIRSVGAEAAGWLHGLKIVAVAVVAQAVWIMARNLAWDRARGTIALCGAALTLAYPGAVGQIVVIVAAAIAGWRFLEATTTATPPPMRVPIGRRFAIGVLATYVALLGLLPLLRQLIPSQPLAVADSFYRAGALVFGGGHVVLPLLQAEVVPPGWLTQEQFLAGYGAAQAVPGPLFTFAAYLGAVMANPPNGGAGAALALGAIFLPSFLLAFFALGSWGLLRSRPAVQAALRGANAGVVGLLLAALYTPLATSAIGKPIDVVLALVAFGLLAVYKVPPWIVVLIAAAGGRAIG